MALYGNNKASIDCLFSDRVISIANACRTVWPHVFHGICLWHLEQNIIRSLGSRLGDSFNCEAHSCLRLMASDAWQQRGLLIFKETCP